MPARVATAAETVACEVRRSPRDIVAELMERAGRAAADEIIRRFHLILSVAQQFSPGGQQRRRRLGCRSVSRGLGLSRNSDRAAPVKTEEAQSAEHDAGVPAENLAELADVAAEGPRIGDAPVIVDALLGTGTSGAPRDTVAAAIEIINRAGCDGAVTISLDVPSGLDASTGQHELCVEADLTLTFGVVKRGLLVAREVCGEIVVLDIGLENGKSPDSLPLLVDHDWVSARIPEIPSDAHKGTRRRPQSWRR